MSMLKREIKTVVTMHSECSDADLSDHIDNFMHDLKVYADDLRTVSWHTSIATSWDESHKVDIETESEVTGE